MPRSLVLLLAVCLALLPARAPGAGASLVPEIASTAPDYFCTWNAQGFACSYAGASAQADMMVEASLFGHGLPARLPNPNPDLSNPAQQVFIRRRSAAPVHARGGDRRARGGDTGASRAIA